MRGVNHLVVHVARSIAAHSRVGIIVPKHAHAAVDRNQLKRRLRELVRIRLFPALATVSPADIVIRALPSAYGQPFEILERQIDQMTRDIPGLCGTF